MPDEKPSCVPCALGIPVAIAEHICNLTNKEKCEQLKTDLEAKKISTDQYFNEVEKILHENHTDEGFMTTFTNARKVYDSVKAKGMDQGK